LATELRGAARRPILAGFVSKFVISTPPRLDFIDPFAPDLFNIDFVAPTAVHWRQFCITES
jgi:hypothetical protein